MKDHDRFESIAAGVQSFFVSAAVAVGGVWTVYTFGFTQDVVSLDLRIETRQIASSEEGKTAALVTVTAQNKGTRIVMLDLSKEPLLIQKVATTESGEWIAEKTWTTYYYSRFRETPNDRSSVYSQQGVQAKSTKTMSFYQELDGPGVYFAKFQAPSEAAHRSKLSDPNFDENAAGERLLGKEGGRFWAVATYFSTR